MQYVHYEVDQDDLNRIKQKSMSNAIKSLKAGADYKMMSPQVPLWWITLSVNNAYAWADHSL